MAITISRKVFGRFAHLRNFSSAPTPAYKEGKRKVLDTEINLVETQGSSKNAPPIFFLPGTLGSIQMDFTPIIPQLNKDKYKWIAWDPPGYGKSRPPNREFCPEKYGTQYFRDVMYVKELMKMLGYERYTLLAWSGAAHTAITIAAEQPEKVSGLITWGGFRYTTPEMVPRFKAMEKMGIEAIPAPRRVQFIDMYGEEYTKELWYGWCREAFAMQDNPVIRKGGTFQETIRRVQCPALVIQGTKDALVGREMADDLAAALKNSRLQLIENGTHNLHLRETKEFVKCIEEFVDKTASH